MPETPNTTSGSAVSAPRPWHTGTAADSQADVVFDANGVLVCWIRSDPIVAALIVRSANSHDDLVAKLEKIARWLDGLARQSDAQAKTSDRFHHLQDANLADARNYRATAKDIRAALANAKAPV